MLYGTENPQNELPLVRRGLPLAVLRKRAKQCSDNCEGLRVWFLKNADLGNAYNVGHISVAAPLHLCS